MNRKILLILVFALLIRMISSTFEGIKGWDEAVYANLGWQIKEGIGYSFEKFDDRNFDFGNSAGFRAPLLPFLLAIVYFLFGNNYFAVSLLMPVMSMLGVLAVYLLGKEMFDEETGIYAALFLSVIPIHVLNSGLMLTDVLVTTLLTFTVLCFWKGFIKNENHYKELCGFTAALAILARYTAVFILLVFFIIWLIDKKRKLEKGVIYAVMLFLLTLSPWLLYSYEEYGAPFGAFIHAQKAPGYCCGEQPWYYFIQNSLWMFGFFSIVFVYVLIKYDDIPRPGSFPVNVVHYLFRNFVPKDPVSIYTRPTSSDQKPIIGKTYLDEYKYLLLWLWIIAIFAFINSVPHKELRYAIPLLPAFVILSAYQLKGMKYVALFLAASSIILVALQGISLYNDNPCFFKSIEFLSGVDKDSVLVTWPAPRYYFYTHIESHFPKPSVLSQIKGYEKKAYVVWLQDNEYYDDYRPELKQLDRVFYCSMNNKTVEIFAKN